MQINPLCIFFSYLRILFVNKRQESVRNRFSSFVLPFLSSGHAHTKLRTSSKDRSRFPDGGSEHAECIVKRPLGLPNNLFRGASNHDGAGFTQGDATELEQGLIADHHLLDHVAFSNLHQVWVAKRGNDLSTWKRKEAKKKKKKKNSK